MAVGGGGRWAAGGGAQVDKANIWATTKDYEASYARYFRPCFEGIDPSDKYAKGLERLGASLHPPHGATHTFMGGSLATPTSPNDPIFFHLHTNVDRLWAEYQVRRPPARPPPLRVPGACACAVDGASGVGREKKCG